MKEQVIDYLIQGDDISSQGPTATSLVKQFLSDLAHELAPRGSQMVLFGLPIARRLVGDPEWQNKLRMMDFISFCETRIHAYPQSIEENSPGLDVQAQYLSDCADEYMKNW
jgi:hypothetical protein